jgi:hypothetical protein
VKICAFLGSVNADDRVLARVISLRIVQTLRMKAWRGGIMDECWGLLTKHISLMDDQGDAYVMIGRRV